jgi:hypothetical protein
MSVAADYFNVNGNVHLNLSCFVGTGGKRRLCRPVLLSVYRVLLLEKSPIISIISVQERFVLIECS